MDSKAIRIFAKDDIEGLASAIVLNTHFFNSKVNISFHKYETPADQLIIDKKEKYNTVLYIGLKNYPNNISKIDSFNDVTLYDTVVQSIKKYPRLKEFCDNISSYLDWTWKNKGLFYGKNLDELSKFTNKNKLVHVITNRVITNKPIVTEEEKHKIIFGKKIMTDYIEKKNYFIQQIGKYKIACVFADINEIELANKISEKENVDAVAIVNLNTGIARVKTNNKAIKDNIKNNNFYLNCNGGTLKLSDDTLNNLEEIAFRKILASIEGGR